MLVLFLTIASSAAIILPSLQCLNDNLSEIQSNMEKGQNLKMMVKNSKFGGISKRLDCDSDREDECGICLEPCTRMVLPDCCHAMCINCYHDWSLRSASCPFCRGSLKRVNSGDLWVLTCDKEVADRESLVKEDMLRFHLYINSLPKDTPDALFLVYYEYLI
ncbi:OLC1v1013515C1 [Oldenlandia corymbosa var. corymbosa]|uniref:OLC1v1013515C1 n=1 Tax=Oldenlandia corymbosa var. corymbosa TaxID=529605 RepID=A0AAV1E0K2_OLDCO|nr:OLC1v1013515C1 [Oldenlandia corymbosa var. corymbosa]